MSKKIKWGVLGGGGDSLIGVLHRVAASMHDAYELCGGVFNANFDESLDFAKSIGLPTNRIYPNTTQLIEKELALTKEDRIQVVSVLTPNFLNFTNTTIFYHFSHLTHHGITCVGMS